MDGEKYSPADEVYNREENIENFFDQIRSEYEKSGVLAGSEKQFVTEVLKQLKVKVKTRSELNSFNEGTVTHIVTDLTNLSNKETVIDKTVETLFNNLKTYES